MTSVDKAPHAAAIVHHIPGTMGRAALEHAERGWHVFPCWPSDKQPLTAHGFKDATDDPAQIAAWWQRWPDALIGVRTGPESGLWALDADLDPAKGLNGPAALIELEQINGALPETVRSRTPRGGNHLLFRWSEGVRNSAGKIAPGIDVRGSGGYVIAPPSVRADGVAYAWDDPPGLFDVAEAPAWLLERVTRRADQGRPTEPAPAPRAAPPTLRTFPPRYVEEALEGEHARVADAAPGQRNPALNEAGFRLGQLVGAGALDRGTVEATLIDAATLSGLVQEDGARAVQATIRSGLAAGEKLPREAPEPRSRRVAARAVTPPRGGPDAVSDLLTEDSAALRFTALHRDRLRYCHDTGAWFVWSGAAWEPNRTGLAFQWARELARELAREESAKAKAITSKVSFAGGVERFCRSDPAFAVTAELWDPDPWLLGTPGGTVDLRTGGLRMARPEDGITKLAGVAPADGADCPLWLAFLDQATGGDAGLIRFLQQWAGYCLTGMTREHALVFVYGPGGNGKSVFLNVLTAILGAYATTAAMDTFTASHGDKHSTDLAMLRGARLVTASETEEGRAWAEARIKRMTGGDPITARFMRQDNFTFMPSFKLTIVGNHKPVLKNVDDAARRRFNIVPFIRKPERPDRQLEAKLKAEWPSILRWMIEGSLDWQANGLTQPASVAEATEAYFSDQDVFGEWLAAECHVDAHNLFRKATTAELFESWTAFAKANNEAVGSVRSFTQGLEKRGFQQVKNVKTVHGTRARGFSGIELLAARATGASHV